MNPNFFRLVYCSRNLVKASGAELMAELESILASSRKNNSRLGITGALLYNAGNFAQVLEGPLQSVEQVFEIIQRDPRHGEVTVVQSGPSTQRDFPEWSMAFTGSSNTANMPLAAATFDAVHANPSQAGDRVLSVLKDLVVLEDEWAMMNAA